MPTPPLSLYVHLPWCVRKCPYCDFNSHVAPEELPEQAYVQALLEDLRADAPAVEGREIGSVFIGGGTPSLFSAAAIERVLHGVGECVALSPDCEITLEANPGTVEAGRFEGYLQAGVNRLSIGVQSFDDGCLRALGRIHGADEARTAIARARTAGFARVNVDLMFALPGQDERGAVADVDEAISSGASHVSHYHLTLEPNTLFHRFPPPLPDADAAAAMQDACAAQLRRHGFGRYEVSAWAQPGQRCRHNLNYWRFGDYIGIGAGAHGKISDAGTGEVWRSVREKHPRRYLQPSGVDGRVASRRRVAGDELAFEFMLNALRLCDGVEWSLFEQATGLTRGVVQRACAIARERGLLMRSEKVLCATPLGQDFLDDLVALFLGSAAADGVRRCARPLLYSSA